MSAASTRHRASAWIWLSVGASLVTMALKSGAAWISGSVGFLSDAMESGVNLVAALVALFALRWSEAPPDEKHPFGHSKGELLSALLEGVLVFVAGVAIIAAAIERFVHPAPISSLSLGIGLSFLAALVNGVVGVTLVRVGRASRSNALEADGHHLMTDVWTSLAVIVGVGLVLLTGATWLDPLSASLVALLVLRTGIHIFQRAIGGLVDTRLGPTDAAALERAVAPFRARGARFLAIRTRDAGRHVFVQLTVQVPETWSVRQGHDLADEVERAVAKELELATVVTHIEPLP